MDVIDNLLLSKLSDRYLHFKKFSVLSSSLASSRGMMSFLKLLLFNLLLGGPIVLVFLMSENVLAQATGTSAGVSPTANSTANSTANPTVNVTPAPEIVPGEYLVKYRDNIRAGDVSRKLMMKAAVKGSFHTMGIYHLSMKMSANRARTYEEIKNDPDVEFIEPNYVIKKAVDDGSVNQAMGITAYSDMVSSASYGARSYGQSAAPVKVNESWNIMTPANISTGDKIIVAVVDTGLDSSHQVFKSVGQGGTGAIWTNPREIPANGIDDDYNGFVDDVNGWNFISNSGNFFDDDGHGTHVSGIILGVGTDILAQTLEESKIEIMPLKFLGADGSGSTANAVRAISYAINNGAKVINNSWGGGGYSRALHEALSYAYNHQVLIVNAAGNYSSDNDNSSMYPANLDVPSVISVAAVNNLDRLASFSNFGSSHVQVAAPGVSILSTVPGNYFAGMSGTSMAAPFVSGLAALVWREAPGLTGYQVKDILIKSSDSISGLQGKVAGGRRVDAYSAISSAKIMNNVAAFQPTYTPSYGADASRSTASESGDSQKGGCGMLRSGGGFGPTPGGGLGMLLLVVLFAPLVVWYVLRTKDLANPIEQRRHDRFRMNSEVRIRVGDREIVGSTKTISMGGLSFNVNEALDKGGIITLQIASPDGAEKVEVQGEIVWSESSQAYGVQFSKAKAGAFDAIHRWTFGLSKAN